MQQVYKLILRTALVTHIRHVSSKDSGHLQGVPLHKVWAYIVQGKIKILYISVSQTFLLAEPFGFKK
jgi:hypothetical protein